MTGAIAPAGAARAQTHQHAAAENHRERYVIPAVRIDQAPRLDGVLDDQVWQKAAVIQEFTQQEPREGAPASERTEVRVLYDGRSLLIGVHAFDANPQGIVATEMRRDSDRLLDEDNFELIVDTFDDSRNGYMFVTTPLGAKLEQQISEEGEGNLHGTNSNVNRNWDGVWDAAARRTADGWTAEISIPTATLRFKDGEEQTWGVNFMRNIRRNNEQVFWAPIPKAQGLTRVSLAGTLMGLRSLSQGLDLKFKPFLVTGVRHQQPASLSSRTSFLHDYGFDSRYGLTSGLNLDVTYNTDFAQVEVDQQQVNLTRFDLFFPEKRDFFLENAGMFDFGAARETEIFFSRRIGIDESSEEIPIDAGARLSGHAGRYELGFLSMKTREVRGVAPANEFTVARVKRQLPNRSSVGLIAVNRQSLTHFEGKRPFNHTFGTDAVVGLGRYINWQNYYARTQSPGLTRGAHAGLSSFRYDDSHHQASVAYREVGPDFNP